jgi:hypothetical protein
LFRADFPGQLEFGAVLEREQSVPGVDGQDCSCGFIGAGRAGLTRGSVIIAAAETNATSQWCTFRSPPDWVRPASGRLGADRRQGILPVTTEPRWPGWPRRRLPTLQR